MSNTFNRRQLLKLLGMTAFGTSISSYVSSAAAATTTTNWGYIGKQAPDYWGKLSPDFGLCSTGKKQTPIDLKYSYVKSIDNKNEGSLKINYQPTPLNLINNGKTVEIKYQPGSFIESEQVYQLLQFHFHHPSEHRIDGEQYDMELHFVHRSQAGNLAVVGVLLTAGKFNQNLQTIWDAIPQKQGEKIEVPDTVINAASLLPKKRSFLTYSGSLTTPPCTENVTWYVLETPIELSNQQLGKFVQLFKNNARPIQALNERVIFESVNAGKT
jgi:carbonic anhydrase